MKTATEASDTCSYCGAALGILAVHNPGCERPLLTLEEELAWLNGEQYRKELFAVMEAKAKP